MAQVPMDEAEFAREIAPYRAELLAHCYRLIGSRSDAEDALQNALVRAWKGFAGFEGRSSLRTWLYRITTHACLDLIGERRARTLPERVVPSGQDAPFDADWLEPLPDGELDAHRAPDAVYASREAVRLAFVVALQVLPPRQRAALILRDVVGLSAEETAATLDLSVAATNSALQRARATLESQPRAKPTPTLPGVLAELLGRYVRAWETGDTNGLIALLRSDAIFSMPPLPLWARGPAEVAAILEHLVWPMGPVRLVPCAANGSPAFGVYQRRGDAAFELTGISVVEIEGDAIAQVHTFLGHDGAPFGLAAQLLRESVEQ
ncbi:MAG TPA: RNA polymerase subunit sigma-70 [Kofleriaceae bacterium]|nr:RNA polymerase subunit sigma-70 [Kofleriaceae bacterium]